VAAWEVIVLAEKEDEEKTYEVKDKRRVNPDGTLRETEEPDPEQAPAGEEAAPEQEAVAEEPVEEAPEQETPGAEGPQLPVPSVYDLLQFMVGMLAEQAWTRMGIRLAPGMREPEKDLGQAKIAIDTIVYIVDAIHPHVGEEERKALRGLVSDLQINFVRQS